MSNIQTQTFTKSTRPSTRCPHCNSDDVKGSRDYEFEVYEAYQNVECEKCGATWSDKYILVGIENLEAPDSKILVLWIEADSSERAEKQAPYARLEVCDVVIEKIAGYRRLVVANNLTEVRATMSPTSWGPLSEDERVQVSGGEEIVVTKHDFQFVTTSGDGTIETTPVSFDELESAFKEREEHLFVSQNPDELKETIRECGDLELPDYV